MKEKNQDGAANRGGLTPLQVEMIDYFVQFARMLNFPKSVGEIYGLLYGSARPLTFDEIVRLLHISKGSASQGLRFLRGINAINAVYVAGDRRDHFVAETRIRPLAASFLRDRVQPRLQNGKESLEKMSELLKSDEDEAREVLMERVKRLKAWNRKAHNLLPAVLQLIW